MTDITAKALTKFHLKENAPLKDQSTFKIGGKARYLFLPKNESELIDLIKFLDKKKLRFLLFGRASNILFADEMKTDFIISTKLLNRREFSVDYTLIETGLSLRELCYQCAEKELSGLEGLSGIPGTVGGAVYMNAGAYGYSFSDAISEVIVYDRKKMSYRTFTKNACGFEYRKSSFMQQNEIILMVKLKLQKGNKEEILKSMKSYELKRAQRQPLNYPSAGSVFKKPSQDFYPAAIIEQLGLKGFCVGGACISSKHSGFIINTNHASANDVKCLIEHIREKVFEKTGIFLETEIEYFE